MARVFFVLFLVVIGYAAHGAEEGQIRLGVQSGHVGLLEDVGTAAGNAVGLGGIFNYAVSDEMMFELSYTGSSHKELKHSDFGVGLNFFFNSYDAAYFYVSGGANFITHDLTALNKSVTGFGLYAGVGADFDMGKNMSAGLQGQYHKAFDASVDVGPVSYKAIQSYVTVMLRLVFAFSNK